MLPAEAPASWGVTVSWRTPVPWRIRGELFFDWRRRKDAHLAARILLLLQRVAEAPVVRRASASSPRPRVRREVLVFVVRKVG